MSTLPLPSGWTDRDARAVEALAAYFKADPRGILAIWNSESGIKPHLAGPAGYFGLIMAKPEFVDGVIGTSWRNLVLNGSIVDQIAAIKQIWDSSAKTFLRESVSARAARLHVRGDTVLYSLNFVPGYFAKMTSATQPMVIKGGGPDNGVFYRDNPGFDLDGKGYITVMDVQKRIDRMMAQGLAGPMAGLFANVKGGEILGSLPFLIGTAIAGGLAAPLIGVTAPIGAALGAAGYGAYRLVRRWI